MTETIDDPKYTAYVRDELDPEERLALQAEIESSEDLSRDVEEIREAVSLLSQALDTEPVVELAREQRRRIEVHIEQTNHRTFLVRPSYAAGLAVAACMIVAVLWMAFDEVTLPGQEPVTRLTLDTPPLALSQGPEVVSQGPVVALSPNGTHVVYVAQEAGVGRLYVRQLDSLESASIAGTENARAPFFSPDGLWVAFFAGAQLKKVEIGGGPPLTLCDTPPDDLHGGSWGDDDTIVFSAGSLWQVPASGGAPEEITVLDTVGESHRYPQILPGGRAVLFSVGRGDFGEANIEVLSLDTGERKVVHRGGFYPRYLPTGHLAFVHEATLFTVPFDLDRLEPTSSPSPVPEDVWSDARNGEAAYAFSQTGSLVYVAGGETRTEIIVVQNWFGELKR